MKDRPTQTFVTDGWKDGQKLIVGRLEIESIADRRTEPHTHTECKYIIGYGMHINIIED